MNRAPDYVRVSGKKVYLNTDFRTSIRFELLMTDTTKSDDEKLRQALKLYYGRHDFYDAEIEDAINGIIWFYSSGNELTQKVEKQAQAGFKKSKIYDYIYDADYIYAAFLQQYNVDLQQNLLHWWKFKAMFQSLTDQCEIIKIMGYRSIEINNNMTKSQKEFYQKMKKIHALPRPKSEVEKMQAIEEALLNGGDLSSILGVVNGSH